MRQAIRAILHSSIHVQGIGTVGDTLPPNGKTLDNLKMEYGTEGLIVDCTFKGLRVSFAVPSANVKVVQLAPEEAPKPETKAKK